MPRSNRATPFILPRVEILGYAVALMAFLTMYALLYARARRRRQQPRVQWVWLAAIVLCALAALALGALL